MKMSFEDSVADLVKGSIDIHIHSAPDVVPRILNVMELARNAQENGMKAILLKNHFSETASQAQVVSKETGFLTLGGIALNLPVGGLNPYAVENALNLGVKIVWLPTFHSKYYTDYFRQKQSQIKEGAPHFVRELKGVSDIQGVSVLNDDGSLKKEMLQIFDLIAQKDAILATGHISLNESKMVIREGVKRGLKKIIVTHPEARFLGYKLENMKEMLELGASYLEFCYCGTTRQVAFPLKREDLYNCIKNIGPKYAIMSTDSGQWLNPVPVQQMGIYIKDMLDFGLSPKDIRTMVSDNPSKVLSI